MYWAVCDAAGLVSRFMVFGVHNQFILFFKLKKAKNASHPIVLALQQFMLGMGRSRCYLLYRIMLVIDGYFN